MERNKDVVPAETGTSTVEAAPLGTADMRKDQIMCFIINFLREKGYCPSIREIGKGVGLRSPSTVYLYIRKLAEEGQIILSEGTNEPRAYRVAGYTFISEQELEELRGKRNLTAGYADEEDEP